jgi:hypothetical protein
MSPVSKERFDTMRSAVMDVLGKNVSPMFVSRVDAILKDWFTEKISAAQACEKVQKLVTLFIDEDKAREIGSRCAPIVMRESVSKPH